MNAIAATIRCAGGLLLAAAASATSAAPPPVVASSRPEAAAGRRCAVGMLPDGAADQTFSLAGWRDRDYDLELPRTHRCGEPIAVVIVYHGGGGNKDNMRPLTCPDGDVRSDECLDRSLLAAGMAVVIPNGTDARGAKLISRGGLRTWNAGGGGHDGNGDAYVCANGVACTDGVDDIAYTRALLADVARRVDIDLDRVFATGFSNGAAMTQRLACEAAETFAAVAPVSGENQFAVAATCRPARLMAVLDIHGTADLCWPYDGGHGTCLDKNVYASAQSTLAGWAARFACVTPPRETALPPRPGIDDGTSVVRLDYDGCAAGARLEHLRVVGNGHYWPNGKMYASGRRLGGTMSRQLDSGKAIADFFVANPRR